MNIRSIISFLIAFQLMLSLSGCGPSRRHSGLEENWAEPATIKGTRVMMGFFSRKVRIVLVDDQEVKGNQAVLSPGPHKIHVRIGEQDTLAIAVPVAVGVAHQRRKSGLKVIGFVAKAGHKYRVNGYLTKRGDNVREWLWIKDITEGRVVAGEHPPYANTSL